MIRVEFIRQLRRGRTWGLFIALVLVPLIIGIANRNDTGHGGRRESNLFTAGTNTGLNFSIFNLLIMSNFFLVVIVAAVAGESVAGEATWGTLRYLLIRPVGRVKLILAKLFVADVLAVAATTVIVFVSLGIGTVLFGWKDALIVNPRRFPPFFELDAGEAFGRLLLSLGYVSLCMIVVVSIGIFLSTMTDSTAAAVVGTIVIVVTCSVLLAVPSLRGLKPVNPTRYWADWNDLFYSGRSVELWRGTLSAVLWSTAFSLAAVLRFRVKDIRT